MLDHCSSQNEFVMGEVEKDVPLFDLVPKGCLVWDYVKPGRLHFEVPVVCISKERSGHR